MTADSKELKDAVQRLREAVHYTPDDDRELTALGDEATFCRAHFPVGEDGEFVWTADGVKVGT